jgi:hypothetical protein
MVWIITNRAAAPYSPTSARLPKGASIRISARSIINLEDMPSNVGAAMPSQISVCGVAGTVEISAGKRGRIQKAASSSAKRPATTEAATASTGVRRRKPSVQKVTSALTSRNGTAPPSTKRPRPG